MQMPQFIKKFRRDRWVNLVLYEGRMLDEAYQQLNALAAYESGWDEERTRLANEIERRERKLDDLRTKLKETA